MRKLSTLLKLLSISLVAVAYAFVSSLGASAVTDKSENPKDFFGSLTLAPLAHADGSGDTADCTDSDCDGGEGGDQ